MAPRKAPVTPPPEDVESECSETEAKIESEDDEFVVDDEDDVEEELEGVGGLDDMLMSFFTTSEEESIADVCKGIQEEIHTLNKTLLKLTKHLTNK